MKKLLFPCCIALLVFSCKPGTQTDEVASTDSTTSESAQDTQGIAIPEKDSTWVDHTINETNPKLVISTPKGMQVYGESYGNSVSVMLNENHSMFIQAKSLDMQHEKQWYRDSRTDLQWLIDTDTEVLYTGTDLSAPKGHQSTNSFFAMKKVGTQDFSTSVDGIVIKEDKVYNLSMDQCQLLLGIFRTLRPQ